MTVRDDDSERPPTTCTDFEMLSKTKTKLPRVEPGCGIRTRFSVRSREGMLFSCGSTANSAVRV